MTIAINFNKAEAEAVRHRLAFLAALDLDGMLELFEEEASLDCVELVAYAGRADAALRDPLHRVLVDRPEHVAILVEAIEGATVHAVASEEAAAGRVTRIAAVNVRHALRSAGRKVTAATGSAVRAP